MDFYDKAAEPRSVECPSYPLSARGWEDAMRGRPCKITFRDESTMMGRFLSFSTDFEELRDGIGQMPVALVELDNGEVKVVYAEQIQFMDRRWK